MKIPVVEVKDLIKNFKVGKVTINALEGVNFSLYAGEFLIIYGPSGCGKSTLLNMIAKLEDYDSGDIFIRGENLKKLKSIDLVKYRRNSIGMVFQNFNLIPSLSVLDNVALPLNFSGIPKRERQKRAKETLTVVGLQERIHHFPNELSGGEQQRVAIARALVTNPRILLVDEPTGNLDEKSGWGIMSLLRTLNKKYQRTILLVTHNSAFFSLADRILYMKDGKIEKQDIVPDAFKLKTKDLGNTSNLSYFIPSRIRNHMRTRDIFGLAYQHFRFVRSRTFLTMLGIIVGISAIVLLVSLGFGLQSITTSKLANFEALFSISVAPSQDNKTLKLDEAQVKKIKNLENVELVSPILNFIASGILDRTTTSIILTGIEPSNLKFEQVDLEKGRTFSNPKASEAIVSKSALKAFDIKDEDQILNKKMKINIMEDNLSFTDLELTIVGIASEKPTPAVYVPISVLSKNPQVVYSSVNVKIKDRNKMDNTIKAIRDLGFEASSASELIDQVDKAFLIIQIVLGIIGAIAFIVASFGILNTMTISLLERTNEIGIMKALGISNRDIRRIFIYEASLFGLFGGIGGIAWGSLLGKAFNFIVYILMQKSSAEEILTPFITPYKFAIIVLLFSLIVAGLAGVYPAYRAARLSPLGALRHE